VHGNLASVGATFWELGSHEEALQHKQQALCIRESELGEASSETAEALTELGVMLWEMGRLEKGLQHYKTALSIYQAVLGDRHPRTAETLANVGIALRHLGHDNEALPHVQEGLALRSATLGDTHPDTAQMHGYMGEMLWELGRHEVSLQHFLEANHRVILNIITAVIHRAMLGDAHPHTLTSLFQVSSTFIDLKKGAESVNVLTSANVHGQRGYRLPWRWLQGACRHASMAGVNSSVISIANSTTGIIIFDC
jgi:hypothetical protein